LRDASSLFAALEGVEQLFLLAPHGDDQQALEANAVDAAKAAGVRRIVKIPGGAPSLGPNGPSTTSVAHWRSEQRIEDSGMAFCFLRPSFLMQNLLETVAPIVSKTGFLVAPMGHGPIAMVDARDVADCAIAALLNPEAPDQAWHLTGPRRPHRAHGRLLRHRRRRRHHHRRHGAHRTPAADARQLPIRARRRFCRSALGTPHPSAFTSTQLKGI
jgi:uncharacterized protein YbjT (DUF2867 family)